MNEEVAHGHVADVPEDKRHRSTRLCSASFCSIPDVSVAKYASGAVAIDVDAVTRQDKARRVVLEGDGIVILRLSPVGDVGAQGPNTSPLDYHIVHDWVEL